MGGARRGALGHGAKKAKKPLLYFLNSKGAENDKPLGLNSTNCKTIAAMYGNDTDRWIGKRITMWPTTTQFGADTVDCIRVRPIVPADAPKKQNNGNGRAAAQTSDPRAAHARRGGSDEAEQPQPPATDEPDPHGDPPPPDDVELPGGTL